MTKKQIKRTVGVVLVLFIPNYLVYREGGWEAVLALIVTFIAIIILAIILRWLFE